MCGKGYEPCRPGEPSVLDLKLPAIDLFVFGSAKRDDSTLEITLPPILREYRRKDRVRGVNVVYR